MLHIIINLMNQQTIHPSASARSLCGPFDHQFKRKFLGNRSTSLLSQRNRLLKQPFNHLSPPLILNTDNLLPKIREIEKIARSGAKKPNKKKKYGEVISDLELYLAKKLVSNQSTKDIISKIEAAALRSTESVWMRRQNATATRKYSQTSSKFYNGDDEMLAVEERRVEQAGQTAYSQGRKWISDQQFKDKFDRFVMKKHEEEVVRLNDLFGVHNEESAEQLRSIIHSDKGELKQIVKKMIDNHHYDSEGEVEETAPPVVTKVQQINQAKERKSINWILQKCDDFHKVKRQKKLKKQ